MIDWEKLARAEAHPLRVKLLEAIDQASEPCSPKQLSDDFDASLGVVACHVGELAEAGLIELARTEPRRGALAHFYRMAVRG